MSPLCLAATLSLLRASAGAGLESGVALFYPAKYLQRKSTTDHTTKKHAPFHHLAALTIGSSRQVLGHLGFDFEDEQGVPLRQEVAGTSDGKTSPTTNGNKFTPSRGNSQFLSWGGTSAMSFEVSLCFLPRQHIFDVCRSCPTTFLPAATVRLGEELRTAVRVFSWRRRDAYARMVSSCSRHSRTFGVQCRPVSHRRRR